MAKLALLGQNTGSIPASLVSVSFDGNSASLNDDQLMFPDQIDENNNNYSLYHDSSIYEGAGTSSTSAAAKKAKEQMV